MVAGALQHSSLVFRLGTVARQRATACCRCSVCRPKVWAQPDSQGSFFTPCQPNGCPSGSIMSASCTVLTNAPAVVGAAGVPLVHPQNCTATTNNAWHPGRKFGYLCEMYAYTGGTVTVPNVPPYFFSTANT